MLADATEALIGAICFDKDISAATQAAKRLWSNHITAALKRKPIQPVAVSKISSKPTEPSSAPKAVTHQRKLSDGAIRFFARLPSFQCEQLLNELSQRPDYAKMRNNGKKGYTPLMYEIEQLGKKKITPQRSKDGWTIMCPEICRKDRLSCIAALIDHGATLHDKATNGKTAKDLLDKSTIDMSTKQAIFKLVPKVKTVQKRHLTC